MAADSKENLFQTPNPTELKAAKDQPLAGVQADDDITEAPESGTEREPDLEVGQPEMTDEAGSQITKANLSGH